MRRVASWRGEAAAEVPAGLGVGVLLLEGGCCVDEELPAASHCWEESWGLVARARRRLSSVRGGGG